MNEKSKKVLSFPAPVPSKADYQRVKSTYTIREIKQLFGLSERTIRRWTEQGIVQPSSYPENTSKHGASASSAWPPSGSLQPSNREERLRLRDLVK